MKTWPRAIIRFIAIANILLGGFGLYLQADSARRFIQRNQLGFSLPQVYWAVASISFAVALATLLFGFFLWRTDRIALRLCNWLFGFELVYWVGTAMFEFALWSSKAEWAHSLSTNMAGAGGIGNMGTALQFISGYPVWALILLNVAYRRMKDDAAIQMGLTRISKIGVVLIGLGLFISLGFPIWLKVQTLYSVGALLSLIGVIMFLVPFLKAKSEQSKPPDLPNSDLSGNR
jgi:hypothetical protein